MSNATRIDLRLTTQELKALMFGMQAWAETVKSFPVIPDGADRDTVRTMRRDVFALNERIQNIGKAYGIEGP